MSLAVVSTGPVAVGSPREPAVALVGAPVGFTPKSLPGLALWLDASQIGGLNDGDPVATWSDLSGLGNSVTQGTSSKRPTYKAGIVNGRPVVRFDGVDDFLSVALPASLQVDSYTYIVVAKVASAGAVQCLFEAGDVAVADQIMGITSASNNKLETVAYNTAGSLNDNPISTASVTGSFGVFTSRRSTAEGSVLNRINGTQDGIDSSLVATTAGYGTAKVAAVGGRVTTQFANCDIQTVLAYSRDLSVAEMLKLERYLGSLNALAVS